MEVYIDILILENTLINTFILLLALKLTKMKYRIKFLYLAATIGALYTLTMFSNIRLLTSMFMKLIVAFFMVYLSLREKRIINILKATGIFFLIAFALGGICLSFVFMQNQYLVGENFIINNYSQKYLVLSVMVIYILVMRLSDYLRERALIKNFTYDIYIDNGDKKLLIKGFLDTGNELREPVTNLPCIIVENKYLKELNINEDEKFVINYKTIKEQGSIRGFKGKDIKIRNCESGKWTSIEAIICECDVKLSKEDDFQALLSRGIV